MTFCLFYIKALDVARSLIVLNIAGVGVKGLRHPFDFRLTAAPLPCGTISVRRRQLQCRALLRLYSVSRCLWWLSAAVPGSVCVPGAIPFLRVFGGCPPSLVRCLTVSYLGGCDGCPLSAVVPCSLSVSWPSPISASLVPDRRPLLPSPVRCLSLGPSPISASLVAVSGPLPSRQCGDCCDV